MNTAGPAAAPRPAPRPEQAIAARHRAAEAKTASVGKAIKTLARTGAPVTCAGVARLAGVSRSFLYENDQARALITTAQARTQARTAGTVPAATSQQEASWRERALNAEQRARDLHHELTAQRHLTAGLLGQLRQPDGTWLADENTRLRQQHEYLLAERNQLARDRNDLHRKLDAARANLARLTEQRVTSLFPHGPGHPPGADDSPPAITSRLPPARRCPTPGDRRQHTETASHEHVGDTPQGH
jgi:hypothetical protein